MPRRLDELQTEDVLRAISLHRWFIFMSTSAIALFSALHAFNQPSLYQATARILIETDVPSYVQFQEAARGSQWDRAFLLTEYQVIASRAVMARVVDNLHLSGFPPFSRAKDPVRALQRIVSVDPVRGTRLVDISATGHKPEIVARIANAVADTYAQLNLDRRRESTTGGVQWLREEVAKMEEKMRTAQLALQEFREQHGSIDFGEERQNTVMQRLTALNASLSKTREDRIEAETKYREKHPTLQELLAKERELQLALFDQEQRALEMSRLSIQYNTLLREAKTSESIYNILLTRLKELSVQEGMQANNVQVVDYALVPDRPVGPPRTREVVLGTLLGFLLACGVSLIRELLTKTIRVRQDFEQVLGIPFLGYVPLLSPALRRKAAQNPLEFILKEPVFTESIRSLRTTLEFILSSQGPHALLVTSSVPEEGKSLVSLALAVSLAELGRRVLILDGDLRRPTLHRSLQIKLEPGLSEYLQGTAEASDLLQQTPQVGNLQAVTAGLSPSQPMDLLTSPKLRDLLNAWRQDFQYIFIDSPPTLIAADSVVLSSLTDGAIFLVRAAQTHSEVAVAGKQRLVDVGAKLLGGILNGARLELERGYRYYHYYGSKRYRKAAPLASAPSPRS